MPKVRLPKSQIPNKHYAAMGRVADTWADLEFAIDQSIWELMRTDQAFGACVTSQMISIHPRTKALMSLLNLYDVPTPLVKETSAILGNAAGLSEMRNRLMHDKRLMHYQTKKVVRFEVSAKKNLIFTDIAETVDDLKAFILKVKNLISEFDETWLKIDGEIRTSGGKLRGKLPQLSRLRRGPEKARRGANKTRRPRPAPSLA